jgi:hypothetical protein
MFKSETYLTTMTLTALVITLLIIIILVIFNYNPHVNELHPLILHIIVCLLLKVIFNY